MLAKQAITMITAFDPFLELVQSKFSMVGLFGRDELLRICFLSG